MLQSVKENVMIDSVLKKPEDKFSHHLRKEEDHVHALTDLTPCFRACNLFASNLVNTYHHVHRILYTILLLFSLQIVVHMYV